MFSFDWNVVSSFFFNRKGRDDQHPRRPADGRLGRFGDALDAGDGGDDVRGLWRWPAESDAGGPAGGATGGGAAAPGDPAATQKFAERRCVEVFFVFEFLF